MGQFRRSFPLGIYRFHIRDAFGLIEDEEGTELPDLYAVLAEALRSTHEFLAEAASASGMQFEIADNTGRVVLKVPIEMEAPDVRSQAA